MSAQNTLPPLKPANEVPLTLNDVLSQEEALLGKKQSSALCISGGGIRSATFALGALQGLADLEILEYFDYLSTVSGGGYIGSWLTAWKERWKGLTTPRLRWSAATLYTVGECIVDSNKNVQKVSAVTAPITNVQISNNVLTITAPNSLTPGTQVVFSEVKTAAFLNDKSLTVLSATASTLTASFAHADYASAPDTGKMTAKAAESGSSQPLWPANPGQQVADGSLVWTCEGPQRAANTDYKSPKFILDSNNNLQQLITAGKTGGVDPTWNTATGETTVDGTVSWLNQGPAPTVISQLKPFALPSKIWPDPVQHLREYNNYLSPKLGFFSADTWTLVATVVRNMLLNWLVFIPLLMCGLMLPRIVLSLARLGETYNYWYVSRIGDWFVYCEYILPVLGGLFFAASIFNFLRYLPGMGSQNHTQGQFLKYCFGFICLGAVALITTDAWFTGGDRNLPAKLGFFLLWGWIALCNAVGYIAYTIRYKDVLKARLQEQKNKSEFRRAPRFKWIISLLGAAFLTSLSIAGCAWFLLSENFRYLSWPVYVTFALPLLLLSFGLAVTVFVGFTSRMLGDDDREWLARAGAWGILCVVCWAGISVITLLVPTLLFYLSGKFAVWTYSTFATVGGISGLVSTLAGLSSKTKAQAGKNGASESKQGGLVDIAGKLAAPVFIAVFLTSLVILTNWILLKVGWTDRSWTQHQDFLENTRLENGVLLAVIFLSFSWIMAKFIDINKFSLQAMYRSRLIRAYLGASNDKKQINKFTGFDQTDNCQMKDLTPAMKPFHVVNIALNLVAGKRLAWQQRKAASFTVSALHCGSEELGYRPSSRYGGPSGLSLGTAIAISGAAASPNMGYHSSPALTFIMTLFNARLGSWLGNPNQKSWHDEGPKSAFDSIIREAFGLTDDTSPYVYLSDGGHFENLGLYEMVRRRCKYIVVLDGGCDPKYTYEDLGNALRKIRIDMKIPVVFQTPLPVPGEEAKNRGALAEIRYKEIDSNLDNGLLIYIKPLILGTEDPDVIAYKEASPAFPHESTGNQWFNESQTESYRMLGLCSVMEAFRQKLKTADASIGFPPPLPHTK